MKRYDLEFITDTSDSQAHVERADGEWVAWRDVEPLLTEVAGLKEQVDVAMDIVDKRSKEIHELLDEREALKAKVAGPPMKLSRPPWGKTLEDTPYTPEEWQAPGEPAADGGRVTATLNALSAALAAAGEERDALKARVKELEAGPPLTLVRDLAAKVAELEAQLKATVKEHDAVEALWLEADAKVQTLEAELRGWRDGFTDRRGNP